MPNGFYLHTGCIVPWILGAPNFGGCFGGYVFSKSVLVHLGLQESVPDNFAPEV